MNDSMSHIPSIFFFQAEDGIRDLIVTGVQTCALPIYRDLELVQWLDYLGFDEAWIGEHHSAGWEIISSPEIFIARSEERRVGEEGRSRGSPYHLKKKKIKRIAAEQFVIIIYDCTCDLG